jgi:hypothetical protein
MIVLNPYADTLSTLTPTQQVQTQRCSPTPQPDERNNNVALVARWVHTEHGLAMRWRKEAISKTRALFGSKSD